MASNPYVNKVEYGGSTLIDLTADDVTEADVLSGKSFHLPSGAQGTGSCAYDADTSDANAAAGDIRSGKSGYVDGVKIDGSLTTRTSASLSASGRTVTVPAGIYDSQATKNVATGSATTPATTITKNPSISVDSSTGLITATVSGTQSVTPTVSAGYVSSGTAGTITVSGSNTSQLTTQAAVTITPGTANQTAVAAGKYTTGAVTVAGSANLTAGNIKSGVSIFGVTGTYEGSIIPATKSISLPAQSTTVGSKQTATSTAEGWRLLTSGLSINNVNYKLVKYKVTAGTDIWIKSVAQEAENGASYQFQTASSVSASSNPYLVGSPVFVATNAIVTVPATATYLILSALKTDTTTGVYSYTRVWNNSTSRPSIYEKSFSVSGYTVTANTVARFDLSSSVISQLNSAGTQDLYVYNNNGTLVARAVGTAPTTARTVQCSLIELST